MKGSSEKSFPVNASDYEVYEEIGEGVSAIVYRALCIPLNVIVAIKVLDLERCTDDSVLAGIRREVQTMSSLNHPNVVKSYCSFTDDQKLWVVMPFMAAGSCLHIMKSTHPEGFEESIIATLLYEVLKALAYLHAHGYIHRDVKAGNILIDSNGVVKLADFGVSACMFDTGDRKRSRNTFVGTPCWMAPEVMQQLHGYDFKADIWSFGITALELARGHAPFSKYPPMKVLLMTLQNAPPGLDYKTDKRFSKYFRSLVAACLVKDPKKRPSSEKLLKHRFFQKARSIDYLTKTILHGLSPLGDRFRILKSKEADLLVQNKAICGDKEKLSQQEYIRGISGWNFNLEDLKNEASISQDYDAISNTEDPELYYKEKISCERLNSIPTPKPEEKLNDSQITVGSNGSGHTSPNDEQKFCGLPTYDNNLKIAKKKNVSQSEPGVPLSPMVVDGTTKKNSDENVLRSPISTHGSIGDHERTISLPTNLTSSQILNSPSRKVNGNDDRDHLITKYQLERNCSVGDISEGTIIRRKGRFKVTSGELSPKGTSLTSAGSGGCDISSNHVPSTPLAISVLPSLQCILQQNNMQRETLVKLIKNIEGTIECTETNTNDLSQISPGTAREKELHALVSQLQHCNDDLIKELQRVKTENAQVFSGAPSKAIITKVIKLDGFLLLGVLVSVRVIHEG